MLHTHNVTIIRNSTVTSWDAEPKERPGYVLDRTEYGTLIEHWPDGTHTYRQRKNRAEYLHTFTPIQETKQ